MKMRLKIPNKGVIGAKIVNLKAQPALELWSDYHSLEDNHRPNEHGFYQWQ